MAERELQDLTAVLPPLLAAMEAMEFAARHFDPSRLEPVAEAVGEREAPLRAAFEALGDWEESLAGVRANLAFACEQTLAGFEGLRETPAEGGEVRLAFRALGRLPRAQESLYPLAAGIAPVSRYFLEPSARGDAALLARLSNPVETGGVGVGHLGGEPGARGAFSLYVPETYSADRDWPLVVALHGGSGNGRAFLWTWLRAARTHGAVLVAPTAVGETWALMGEDADTPNLARIVDFVRGQWRIDPGRILLTGMSDGGTFSYVSGLEAGSPFTHLAPVSAAFHPMLAAMADGERVRGLPVHIAHGARDWMFPASMAREAAQALSAAGARVTYREIEDLSHTYPRELNPEILAWLAAGPEHR